MHLGASLLYTLLDFISTCVYNLTFVTVRVFNLPFPAYALLLSVFTPPTQKQDCLPFIPPKAPLKSPIHKRDWVNVQL